MKNVVSQAGALAETAWRWWLSEILAMLPASWRRGKRIFVQRIGGELAFLVEGVSEQRLAPTPGENTMVNFRVGSDETLRRTLRLPIAARFKLREILAQDLERQSPLDPRSVLFTFRIIAVERASSQLLLSLILVRRDVVDAAVNWIAAAGFRLKEIVVEGEFQDDRLPMRQNLPLSRSNIFTVLFAIMAIVLFSADQGVRAAKQCEDLDSLGKHAAQLDVAVRRVQDIRTAAETIKAQVEFLGARRAAPSMGAILAEITRRLPDGTWLYSLDYDGHEIQMQGYSTNASGLVAIFDGSSLFQNAAFRAPMTQGPAPGLQQFDLSMTLAMSQ